MKLTNKEIELVLRLEPIERYRYFIKRVADAEKLYTLIGANGEFALAEVGGETLLSLWSALDFAQMNAAGQWKAFSVKELTLEEFEDDMMDLIQDNGWLLNIFSIDSKSGFVVDINEFARDLNEELSKYD